MTDLYKLTIAEAKKLLENKEISSVELTKGFIERCKKYSDLNAFITTTFDDALQSAELSDKKRAAGQELGNLEGIPIANKDLFCTKGVKTTAASKILENFIPQYESTVTSNLKQAGAISLGKLNLDEFAMGSANLTSNFGAVINPWEGENGEDLVPGGSSGGSAAAISASLALGVTGTDTGGSIRQPASFVGSVGLKPTYGRCSRYGIVAFASSLDQAGPLTKTVEDAAIMLQSMASFDKKDSTSAPNEIPNFAQNLNKPISELKIGIPKEYMIDGLDSDVKAAWEKGAKLLQEQGATIVDVSLPHTQYALATYYIIAPAEASSNLARYDGVRYGHRIDGESLDDMYMKTRASGFGEEVKRRILIGTYVLSAGFYDAYYMRAQKIRRLIVQDFNNAYQDVDLILTPTAPSSAFSANNPPSDPITMYLNDVFTIPASIAGLPAISIPAGLDKKGLPLGLQLIANTFDEQTLLQGAKALEQAIGFNAIPQKVNKLG